MIDLRYGCCCLESLRKMPAASVHCVVTSPPYYGLRNYGVKPSVWGGDLACVHEWADASWRADRWGKHDDDKPGQKQRTNNGALGHRGKKREASTCLKCGAWRGCLGLEPTLAGYIEHLVMVFMEVWRVLRNDGTLWLNIGDSYNAYNGNRGRSKSISKMNHDALPALPSGAGLTDASMKPKDLMGVPWMLAFALRSAGWYLRSDIVWSKPNPMPESVIDRPTHSHEYLFLLSKSDRYYYDGIAIAEPNGPANREGRDMQDVGAGKTRNKRSVWTVPVVPFPGAHFATFPPALIEPCILAGTSARGCCPTCGAQWVRIIESELTFESGSGKSGNAIVGKNGKNLQGGGATGDIRKGPVTEIQTLGWQQTCHCEIAEPVPATVLDCFAGSGTACATAFHLGRNGIGLDASNEYHAIAVERCGGLFLTK